MKRFIVKVQNAMALRQQDEGATMVEYGLMVALIAIVALGAVTLIGTNVTTTFNNIAGHL